jgi:hypothetical protein
MAGTPEERLALRQLAGALLMRFRLVFNDGTGDREVSSATPLPVTPSYTPPTLWAAPGTAINMIAFGLVEVQFAGIAGGDSYVITRSLDGENFHPLAGIYDQSGAGPHATITANGIYSLLGGGYLRAVKTGSASTPVLTYRAGQ